MENKLRTRMKELIATLALSGGFLMCSYAVFIMGRDSALLGMLMVLATALGGIGGFSIAKAKG